jgi:Ni/Co efflux regulator RcnB
MAGQGHAAGRFAQANDRGGGQRDHGHRQDNHGNSRGNHNDNHGRNDHHNDHRNDGHRDGRRHDGNDGRRDDHRRFDWNDHRRNDHHNDGRRYDWRNDGRRNDHRRYDWNDHRHDNRRDRPHYDWNRGRNDYRYNTWNRPRYSLGAYHRPWGWYDHRWVRGERLPRAYYGHSYIIHDYYDCGLRPPPYGYHWVRVDGDAVLAVIATGVILDVIYNQFS